MQTADVIGHPSTILIIVRGNSGSGKSSVARQLQLRHGRGCAWVEQDHLRRIMLRERDQPGGAAPDLIAHTVRYCLDRGYHVVLDGILYQDRYAPMLTALCDAHRGRTTVVYLDVPVEETLRRHQTRPLSAHVSPAEMRSWYQPRDLLGVAGELVIGETSTLEDTVRLIADRAGLPLSGVDTDFRPIPSASVPTAIVSKDSDAVTGSSTSTRRSRPAMGNSRSPDTG